MKLIDIIPTQKNTIIRDWYAEMYKKQIAKKGYYYDFSVISTKKDWFLNNAEKDVVIGYYEEKLTKVVICKQGENNFKCFSWIDKDRLQLYGYTFFNINIMNLDWAVKLLEENSDKAKIVDTEGYEKAKRLLILNSIEVQNE